MPFRTRSRRLSPFPGLFGDRVTGLEAIPCRSRRLLPFPGLFGDRMTRLRAIPHQISSIIERVPHFVPHFQKYVPHVPQSEAQYCRLRTRSRRLSPFSGLFADRVTGLEAIPCQISSLIAISRALWGSYDTFKGHSAPDLVDY